MKKHADFLVVQQVNEHTIYSYEAYVHIEDLTFHRLGSDSNNNRVEPLSLDEFHLLADDEDIQEMFTESALNEYFLNQVKI